MARQRLLQQDVVESTTRSLKEHFVLQKIAEVEKIDISEDDIDYEIERLATQNNESPRRLRARMEKEDLLDVLATEIIENKALEVVLQSAEYEDVPIGATAEPTMATSDAQAIPGEMTEEWLLLSTAEARGPSPISRLFWPSRGKKQLHIEDDGNPRLDPRASEQQERDDS